MKMHILKLAAVAALAFVGSARAQLVPTFTRSFIVYGDTTAVVTRFDFTLEADLKTLHVVVDNRYTLKPGTSTVVGRLTTFGFTVPTFVGAVTLTPPDATWNYSPNYTPSAGGSGAHTEDIGAYVGNNLSGGSSDGIAFGGVATFTFTFANAFTAAQAAATSNGFLTSDYGSPVHHPGLAARWQDIKPNGSTGSGVSDDGFEGYELPIPEPSTYGLVATGILLAGIAVKRRRTSQEAAA